MKSLDLKTLLHSQRHALFDQITCGYLSNNTCNCTHESVFIQSISFSKNCKMTDFFFTIGRFDIFLLYFFPSFVRDQRGLEDNVEEAWTIDI